MENNIKTRKIQQFFLTIHQSLIHQSPMIIFLQYLSEKTCKNYLDEFARAFVIHVTSRCKSIPHRYIGDDTDLAQFF